MRFVRAKKSLSKNELGSDILEETRWKLRYLDLVRLSRLQWLLSRIFHLWSQGQFGGCRRRWLGTLCGNVARILVETLKLLNHVIWKEQDYWRIVSKLILCVCVSDFVVQPMKPRLIWELFHHVFKAKCFITFFLILFIIANHIWLPFLREAGSRQNNSGRTLIQIDTKGSLPNHMEVLATIVSQINHLRVRNVTLFLLFGEIGFLTVWHFCTLRALFGWLHASKCCRRKKNKMYAVQNFFIQRLSIFSHHGHVKNTITSLCNCALQDLFCFFLLQVQDFGVFPSKIRLHLISICWIPA